MDSKAYSILTMHLVSKVTPALPRGGLTTTASMQEIGQLGMRDGRAEVVGCRPGGRVLYLSVTVGPTLGSETDGSG